MKAEVNNLDFFVGSLAGELVPRDNQERGVPFAVFGVAPDGVLGEFWPEKF